jgi:hypothetical protein
MFCRSDLRIRWKGVVGRKSQSGSENQCRDVWSSNFDGQDRLRLSQPHLSRLHQWGLFDMRRHAFEILCMIFRASALTMLLLTHKRRRRKGVRIANRSRSFWPTRGASSRRVISISSPILHYLVQLVLLTILLSFPNICAISCRDFRHVPRSRLLICPYTASCTRASKQLRSGDFPDLLSALKIYQYQMFSMVQLFLLLEQDRIRRIHHQKRDSRLRL